MRRYINSVLDWVNGLDATQANTLATVVSTLVGLAIFIWQQVAPACGG